MQPASLPSIKSIYHTLEEAALDVYGFAVACHGGAAWLAEPALLDSLLLGLESFWFVEDERGRVTHAEFREELFRAVWSRAKGPQPSPKIGTEVPLGHGEMAFYRLPQLPRAALYLRTRKRMSYASIGLILGIAEGIARAEVEKAREFLLGRRLQAPGCSEEEF